jgi:hypothetical protein
VRIARTPDQPVDFGEFSPVFESRLAENRTSHPRTFPFGEAGKPPLQRETYRQKLSTL